MRNWIRNLGGAGFTRAYLRELLMGLAIAGLLGLLRACRRAMREGRKHGTRSIGRGS